MIGEAYGLYGHIRNNRIRSAFLIAGLFLLAYLLTFGVILIGYGMSGYQVGSYVLWETWRVFLTALPFVTAATALWEGAAMSARRSSAMRRRWRVKYSCCVRAT
mgnify:CR=1 FL=1